MVDGACMQHGINTHSDVFFNSRIVPGVCTEIRCTVLYSIILLYIILLSPRERGDRKERT